MAINREQRLSNEGQLRRNIHRLEKGLIMKPFRFPYALEYIHETVAIFTSTLKSSPDSALHQWAHDVLVKYFENVAPESELEPLKSQFLSVWTSSTTQCSPRSYRSDLDADAYSHLRDVVTARASVRHFKAERVPREMVDNALDLARRAPSACNRQPFRYLISECEEDAQEIASISFGTGGYLHEIRNLVVLVGDLSNFEGERDRHLIYVDGSLSAMLFVLGLQSQNIGTCCINWPDIEKKELLIARKLGLQKHERPLMLIAFGYPAEDAMVPYSEKKAITQISGAVKIHEF